MSDTIASPGRPAAAVVLVRPQQEGNVGSVARAMANMGFSRLLLVEPAPPLGATARAFAVGATHILDAAQRYDSFAEATAGFQRVAATSSGRNRRLEQRVVEARTLPPLLAGATDTTTALVFGPEASGLTRDELAICDPLITIPCAAIQPTLNLAQAVLLVCYEIRFGALTSGADPDHPTDAATAGEVERLIGHIDRLLEAVGFDRDDTYQGVLRDLRQLAARAGITEREVQILHGICRRTLYGLSASGRVGPAIAVDDEAE